MPATGRAKTRDTLVQKLGREQNLKLDQVQDLAGVHFIQVAKWLGHSSYVLTLTTYADDIPEQEAENPLPEPVAPNTNVVNLHRSTAG